MVDDFCLMHDDRLGYAPKPGFRGAGASGWPVTIDADGLRWNGGCAGGPADRAILAMGDSYTFGEEVGDRLHSQREGIMDSNSDRQAEPVTFKREYSRPC